MLEGRGLVGGGKGVHVSVFQLATAIQITQLLSFDTRDFSQLLSLRRIALHSVSVLVRADNDLSE